MLAIEEAYARRRKARSPVPWFRGDLAFCVGTTAAYLIAYAARVSAFTTTSYLPRRDLSYLRGVNLPCQYRAF
ncbi:hypothetical protein Taro_020811 [Colocasia esculenta]|uniref:Uncharacterized protein n=1 Tax=Colocasia esculenta TaxID=4460 RepID=A0A843V9L9_COLES|nr:hypothetical protein [Colocasia esculenta]